jgi:hypothetical protein
LKTGKTTPNSSDSDQPTDEKKKVTNKKEINRRRYMEFQHLTALKEYPYLKHVSRPIYFQPAGTSHQPELDMSSTDQTEALIDKQKEAYFDSMALYHIIGLSKWSKLTESRLVPERLIRDVSKDLLEDLFPGRDVLIEQEQVAQEAEAIEEDYYHENYASS